MESVSHLALKLLSLMGGLVHKVGWVDFFRLLFRSLVAGFFRKWQHVHRNMPMRMLKELLVKLFIWGQKWPYRMEWVKSERDRDRFYIIGFCRHLWNFMRTKTDIFSTNGRSI